MNAKYKLLSLEKKTTKSNKPYAIAFLGAEDGREIKASVWDGIDSLVVGQEVEGEVYASGDFTNFRPASATPPPRTGGGAAKMREAQEFKAASIDRAQDRREVGVKLAGAMRDATLITVASLKDQPFPSAQEFKDEWRRWRDFFINEFDTELARLDQ